MDDRDRQLPAVPTSSTHRVDIPPAAIYERLDADEQVMMVERFPPRSQSKHAFLAMRTPTGFSVIQNIGLSTLDGGAPIVRRFHMEVRIQPTTEGALVEATFERGPQLRQLRYVILWGSAIAWLAATGVTHPKLGMVFALLFLTIPALVYDRAKARGSREDRIALLNLMQHLLGSAVIGQSPAEQTPYRDGHPPLPPSAEPSSSSS